jgi:hypothetical protein
MIRRSTVVTLIMACLLASVLLVGSASAASGTVVSFRWTMQVTPGHSLRVKYTHGLVATQSSHLSAHTGAVTHAKFASHEFEFSAVAADGRFSGTLEQSLDVTARPLEGVVTVPHDSEAILRNLKNGEQLKFGPGEHKFTIGTGVSGLGAPAATVDFRFDNQGGQTLHLTNAVGIKSGAPLNSLLDPGSAQDLMVDANGSGFASYDILNANHQRIGDVIIVLLAVSPPRVQSCSAEGLDVPPTGSPAWVGTCTVQGTTMTVTGNIP